MSKSLPRVAAMACFIVLLGLLTACNSDGPNSRTLYSGSRGVDLSFPEQNSFQQFANDTFSIAVRLQNDGAFSINDSNRSAYLNVIFDPSVFELQYAQSFLEKTGGILGPASASIPFLVDGRALDNPIGGVEYADFTFRARTLPSNRALLESPITFQACYPYKTTFLKNVCVDRDYYTQKNTPVCISRTVTDTSQGAPVAVTSVEPRFTRVGQSSVKPRFVVTITNLQDGYTVWTNESASAQELCTFEDFNKAGYGRIEVGARLGATELECGVGSNVTRFEANQARIICGVPEGDPALNTIFQTGANYEALLSIELHYFYITSQTARIQVERP